MRPGSQIAHSVGVGMRPACRAEETGAAPLRYFRTATFMSAFLEIAMHPLRLLPLLTVLTACSAAPGPASAPPSPAVDAAALPAQIGGDTDAHGCIVPAGYSWCERTGQCERPWELAAREGLDDDPDKVTAWCAGAPGDAVR